MGSTEIGLVYIRNRQESSSSVRIKSLRSKTEGIDRAVALPSLRFFYICFTPGACNIARAVFTATVVYTTTRVLWCIPKGCFAKARLGFVAFFREPNCILRLTVHRFLYPTQLSQTRIHVSLHFSTPLLNLRVLTTPRNPLVAFVRVRFSQRIFGHGCGY